MIIVSQDKTEIINFNKVENIYVSGRYISLNFELNNNEVVGTYKTEERAKEVLEEIAEQYEHEKKCECDRSYLETLNNFTYRMPKE